MRRTMLKLAILAFASLLVVLVAPRTMHDPMNADPMNADLQFPQPGATPLPWSDDASRETLAIYYSPLPSTSVARLVGLAMAYHMAIVYTDAAGHSYGVSSGPSNLSAGQTPANALTALAAAASDAPASAFGTLVSDPRNNRAFTIDGAGDFYTHDGQGHPYPTKVVARGRDLSRQWGEIVRSYARIGQLHLPYSPISQNSNSMAATALRRAGLEVGFSKDTPFTPGIFTKLPDA